MIFENELPDTLLERVKYLEGIALSAATGGSIKDPRFTLLRREFMADTEIRQHLPDFIRTCRDLNAFWPWIKNQTGTYAERRQIISQAFTPLIDMLEGGGNLALSAEKGKEGGASPMSEKKDANVFVVHGHDVATREQVVRFIEHCGLQPVVLHEQANRGRTIIEKFEANADVSFAVVLLTPDDQVYKPESDATMRARQNVILELGYFIGKLGRERVCALKRDEVEIPSDVLGVNWTDFDTAGAWKLGLAKELRAAGFNIDMNKLI